MRVALAGVALLLFLTASLSHVPHGFSRRSVALMNLACLAPGSVLLAYAITGDWVYSGVVGVLWSIAASAVAFLAATRRGR